VEAICSSYSCYNAAGRRFWQFYPPANCCTLSFLAAVADYAGASRPAGKNHLFEYISFWETRPLVFAVPSLCGRSTAINQTGKYTTIKLRTQPSPPPISPPTPPITMLKACTLYLYIHSCSYSSPSVVTLTSNAIHHHPSR